MSVLLPGTKKRRSKQSDVRYSQNHVIGPKDLITHLGHESVEAQYKYDDGSSFSAESVCMCKYHLTKEISFTVRGNPLAQKRHRHTMTGIVYDPSAQDKKNFLYSIQEQAPDKPIDGGIVLNMTFYLPIPKSWSKKRKREAYSMPVLTRPDLDNLQKFVMDSINGIYFNDDKQVYSITARKYYTDIPRTSIRLIYNLEKGGNSDGSF